MNCCEFAGWDSEEQFTLVIVAGSKLVGQKQGPETAPETSEEENGGVKKKENGKLQKRDTKAIGVRRHEQKVEIPAGKRISITVACNSK